MWVNQFRMKNFYLINKTKQILGQLGLVFLQKSVSVCVSVFFFYSRSLLNSLTRKL